MGAVESLLQDDDGWRDVLRVREFGHGVGVHFSLWSLPSCSRLTGSALPDDGVLLFVKGPVDVVTGERSRRASRGETLVLSELEPSVQLRVPEGREAQLLLAARKAART